MRTRVALANVFVAPLTKRMCQCIFIITVSNVHENPFLELIPAGFGPEAGFSRNKWSDLRRANV